MAVDKIPCPDYNKHIHRRAFAPVKKRPVSFPEAAVGAGITSLLFFLTLKKIHAIDARNEVRRAHERQEKDGGADNGNA